MNVVMFAMWVFMGLLAGWLAGFVMKRGGYGLRWDTALGLVGSIAGSGIFWALRISPEAGMVAVAVIGFVGFVGAAFLILLQRKIWPAIA
jgi:uncharacterized membrane protein YeaQ/YmgE (transglycosylase-associated protein family)